eukprot:10403351-Karenia_brevis.AAC.1
MKNKRDLEAVRCKQHGFNLITRQDIKSALAPYDVESRLRHKLKRWQLQGSLPQISREVIKSISVIRDACRPCVISSLFRTIWNGWPTTARMRTMNGAIAPQQCIFGCNGAEDRTEHYLVCDKVWAVLQRRPPQGLGLKHSQKNLKAMMLAEGTLTNTERMAIAVACYGISGTVHSLRSAPAGVKARP